ncbi:MAG: aspartate kinase [Spirochaetaceae bacterium]|nr:MAG: aspartate kinase [Spirochaetaceae bacterium]
MRVLSFGEQALKDVHSIKTLHQVVRQAVSEDTVAPVLVVSSLQGMREALAEAAAQAAEGSGGYLERIEAMRERVLEIIRGLFSPRNQSGVITGLQILLNDLEDILHGVQLIRECSPRTLDLVLSFGTRISCILVSRYLDTEGFTVRIEDNPGILLRLNQHGMLQVDYQVSYDAILSTLGQGEGIRIVAGGLAYTEQGALTALQPDGSDLSASLIAAALAADTFEMWTGMEGVMSADPHYVPEAFVIPELSYQEAMELSYFGARMIHSQSLVPAMEAVIPIRVRNLERVESPGTRICADPRHKQTAIAGIASIEPVALVNIEGGGMVGVPGIAARIFATLAGAAVNIIMISQASSEHSICVVFRQQEAERALEALRKELAPEIRAKQIQNFDLRKDLAILAAIGENMRGTPGISGKLFSALGRAKINILAIAQGSSETNISFVIEKAAEPEALRTVHRAFLG